MIFELESTQNFINIKGKLLFKETKSKNEYEQDELSF